MGRNATPFTIYKLRTMRLSVIGPAYVRDNDPRITRFGRWLRRSKLDELPQLWNVLRGDMSLVGPRPVAPEVAEAFSRQYQELLKDRPGLTDPATLKYSNESVTLARAVCPADCFAQEIMPDKLRLSAAYARQATFWGDLALIGKTIGVVAVCWAGEGYASMRRFDSVPALALYEHNYL